MGRTEYRQVFFAKREDSGTLYFVTYLNGPGWYNCENKTILGSYHLLEFLDALHEIEFIEKVKPNTERIPYSTLLSYAPVGIEIARKVFSAIK